ncbi:MAG: DUF3261 domain-containing protein [Desulfonatronovibrio sp.]
MRSLIIVLVLLAGCSASYTAPPGYNLISPEKSLSCLPPPWSMPGKAMSLRQTVFIQAGGQSHIVQGLMQIDEQRRKIQILGMSELGMKLFDIEVTHDRYEHNFLSPAMGNRSEALARQVALSVRRIFLTFDPAANFETYVAPESLLMIDRSSDSEMIHECPLDSKILKETSGPGQGWEVTLTDYLDINGVYLPERITYHDQQAGYKLKMILHEVF